MVYKCQGCFEACRVPHIVYVYVEAISESNSLMKFDQNRKRLRGSDKKLYGIKCIILALRGWGVSKQVVCFILTMLILKLCHNAIR